VQLSKKSLLPSRAEILNMVCYIRTPLLWLKLMPKVAHQKSLPRRKIVKYKPNGGSGDLSLPLRGGVDVT
jgi:hypothetical protein